MAAGKSPVLIEWKKCRQMPTGIFLRFTPMGSSSSSTRRTGAKRGGADDERDDVKRQIDSDQSDTKPIYQLVNVKTGGGKLIELIKTRAKHSSGGSFHSSSTDYIKSSIGTSQSALSSIQRASQSRKSLEFDKSIEGHIRELVEPLLYNGGRGKLVPLQRLWAWRFGKQDQGDDHDEESLEQRPTGGGGTRSSKSYRWVCWKLEERGFVGETALHICFLLSTPSHMILAQKLLALFPMLINDIYTCDEYFGESSLHMAIVNENVKIVKLLLDHGAQVHERCLGSFFLPHDQKARANQRLRRYILGTHEADKLHHNDHGGGGVGGGPDLQSNELEGAVVETNYEAYTYWGEYPLSFAASLGLSDCYKLLLAKGANPNRRDSNGNTTLHICVIANRLDMFDLCYSTGADLQSINRLGLSPLTLAARLRRVEMFFHILTIQRKVSWLFCNVAFLDYPLSGIDSINTQTGACDDRSLLSIVVTGNSNEHLQMLDGLLGDLLQVKWDTSLRHRFHTWLALFLILLVIASLAYITRFDHHDHNKDRVEEDKLAGPMVRRTHIELLNQVSELALVACVVYYLIMLARRCLLAGSLVRVAAGADGGEPQGILDARRRRRRLDFKGFRQVLAQAPELSIFTLTCLLILVCIPLRLLRLRQLENSLVAIIMFLLPLKLLFFCRGSKSLGSFIVMIYKILVNDVLCFVVFLIIFISGFAQSFVIIFKTYKLRESDATTSLVSPNSVNVSATATAEASTGLTGEQARLSSLFESIITGDSYFLNLFDALITMHMMALNEFSWVLDEFRATDYPQLAKVLFCIYMILVSILLINMLIAMLGKTYQDISSQPNENLRQWARALLTLERICSPESRLNMLDRYSHLVRSPQQCRCYSTTWALDQGDLDEIEAIRSLKRDQAANEQRLRMRAKRNSNLILTSETTKA